MDRPAVDKDSKKILLNIVETPQNELCELPKLRPQVDKHSTKQSRITPCA